MRRLPLLAFVGVLVLLGTMLLRGHKTEEALGALPEISLTSMDGKTKWSQDTLKGNVTVLNFFASWCTPCAAEMPELTAFSAQFPEVVLHGVAWNDDPQTLKKWLAKNGNPFRTVWLDEKGEATIGLGLKGVPETIVIDASGRVRSRITGPVTLKIRAKTLDPLIKTLLVEASNAS